ncbi:MAG: phosphomannomutase/phosphoglucomutase [Actinobacteria bacterium]|nr:phosphomannomutase/phosphoglucomutase [Actinomycetota bacterium]
MRDAARLNHVIKAYDVRGVYPQDFDEDFFTDLGAAFVAVLTEDGARPESIVIGHDMRPSAAEIVPAFARGVTRAGVDAVIIGLCSTDGLYFASGLLGAPGAMFTASHNPAKYNGVKLCRAFAAPVGKESGLVRITELLQHPSSPAAAKPGTVSHRDLLHEYRDFLHAAVDLTGIRPLRVAVDAGNGMGGLTVPAVFDSLPIEVLPLYFELDGTFPNHEANPIDPENLRDLQALVRESGADLGLAFDGDADRCFAVDERGELIDPSTMTALIAQRELARHPGSSIIYNLISSRAVPEVVLENGGTPVRSRVGHSFIKAEMARHDAVFGGEHSGHFYFRDFWKADSGILAALHLLAALGETPAGTSLSSMLSSYVRWHRSGEINSVVEDANAVIADIRSHYSTQAGVTTDDLDGLTVSAVDWWFNVRPSNTEPLLRLNVEARSAELLESTTADALARIRAGVR